MNSRILLLASSFIVLPAAGVGVMAAASPEASAKPPAVAPDAPASALKQGMSADEVRHLMGKPDEIRPMKAPNGKAEVWVFTREIGRRVDRVGLPSASIVTTVVSVDGTMRQQTTPGPVQYHDVYYVTEETVELLMFNDHFLLQKVHRRERQVY
jgi:hypothetical protein